MSDNIDNKVYTIATDSGDRQFKLKRPSLKVENLWLGFVYTDEGKFVKTCLTDFSKDSEAVNEFMRSMLRGDHSGIDWMDEDSEIFREVFLYFFTPWSERMTSALDTLSSTSQEKPSQDSDISQEGTSIQTETSKETDMQ